MSNSRRLLILEGDKYGALTVICEAPPIQWEKHKKRMVLCRCSCGNETTVRLEYLRSGHTKSCGCNRKTVSASARKTHGRSKTRLHRIWAGMLNRCRNKNVKSYKDYGAKGVHVCKEWLEFEQFMIWAVGNGYKNDLTIERRNPFGNYEPGNCCWIPKSQQRYNRRDTVVNSNATFQAVCKQ